MPEHKNKKLQSEHFTKLESKLESDKLDIKNNPASVYDDATSLNGKEIDDNKTSKSAFDALHSMKIIS